MEKPCLLRVSKQEGGVSAPPSNPPTRKFIMETNSSFRINSGEIPVVFEEQEVMLKPTLRAATTISRQFNGFAAARAALVAEQLDAVVFILRMGLNLSDRDARDLPERVYKNGITAELLIPLIKYIAILGNGGKPLPDEPEDGTGQNNQAGSEGND